MDFLKKVATEVATEVTNNTTSTSESKGNNNNNQNNDSKEDNNNKENNNKESNTSADGVAGVLLDKINSTLGGGKEGEKKEDILDKAIDLFQERVLKSGDQSNESAAEQAKDKIIADTIRSGYKNITGKDIPI